MYLITANLLNSWKYLLHSGNIKQFERVLNKQQTPLTKSIQTEFAFKKWCKQYFEESKCGMFQVTAKKAVGNYVLYGHVDCVKAGIIYAYKYTTKYDVGKFLGSIEIALYFELIPEAKKISCIISDTDKFSLDNLYREDYTREEIEPIMTTINQFMQWINENGYCMKKWLIKQ